MPLLFGCQILQLLGSPALWIGCCCRLGSNQGSFWDQKEGLGWGPLYHQQVHEPSEIGAIFGAEALREEKRRIHRVVTYAHDDRIVSTWKG